MKRTQVRSGLAKKTLRDDLINVALATAAALFLLVFVSKAKADEVPVQNSTQVCKSFSPNLFLQGRVSQNEVPKFLDSAKTGGT